MTSWTAPPAHPNLPVSLRGEFALVQFDNPPVNALNNGIRAALNAIIDHILTEPSLRGALFIGAGANFVAGADIRELQRGVQAPFLSDMLLRLERSDKVFGAAISGFALGGGMEIALACDLRIARPDARLGLPELKLALIPGAGGTQRLPRLVGAKAALELLLSSRIIPADEALKIGLVDAVSAAEDIADAALTLMRGRQKRAPRAPNDTAALETARLQVANDPALNDLFAATAMIDAVSAAFLDRDAGFDREKQLFALCRETPEAAKRLRAFVEAREARRQGT
jgi:3-hydroxyacyl-CoA dehydrogenase